MVVVEQLAERAPSMGKPITDLSSVTTVGLDLAKHVIQVHGVDLGAGNRFRGAPAQRCSGFLRPIASVSCDCPNEDRHPTGLFGLALK
jgi:hypothetical protein